MNLALPLREALGMEMEFINFGSGIGTVYDETEDRPVDLERLRDFAGEIMSMNRALGARLLIETGRYVLCRAGRYITPVVDKKVPWYGLLDRTRRAEWVPAPGGRRFAGKGGGR